MLQRHISLFILGLNSFDWGQIALPVLKAQPTKSRLVFNCYFTITITCPASCTDDSDNSGSRIYDMELTRNEIQGKYNSEKLGYGL